MVTLNNLQENQDWRNSETRILSKSWLLLMLQLEVLISMISRSSFRWDAGILIALFTGQVGQEGLERKDLISFSSTSKSTNSFWIFPSLSTSRLTFKAHWMTTLRINHKIQSNLLWASLQKTLKSRSRARLKPWLKNWRKLCWTSRIYRSKIKWSVSSFTTMWNFKQVGQLSGRLDLYLPKKGTKPFLWSSSLRNLTKNSRD